MSYRQRKEIKAQNYSKDFQIKMSFMEIILLWANPLKINPYLPWCPRTKIARKVQRYRKGIVGKVKEVVEVWVKQFWPVFHQIKNNNPMHPNLKWKNIFLLIPISKNFKLKSKKTIVHWLLVMNASMRFRKARVSR